MKNFKTFLAEAKVDTSDASSGNLGNISKVFDKAPVFANAKTVKMIFKNLDGIIWGLSGTSKVVNDIRNLMKVGPVDDFKKNLKKWYNAELV